MTLLVYGDVDGSATENQNAPVAQIAEADKADRVQSVHIGAEAEEQPTIPAPEGPQVIELPVGYHDAVILV